MNASRVTEYADDVRLRGVSICPGIGIGRIHKVDVNVLIPQDNLQVALMLAHGLDGIGLFRTEFTIPPVGHMPPEDEQYTLYRRVFQEAAGRFITFRTFDIGADKQMGLASGCAGSNPTLGVRGIRRHLMNERADQSLMMRATLPVGHLIQRRGQICGDRYLSVRSHSITAEKRRPLSSAPARRNAVCVLARVPYMQVLKGARSTPNDRPRRREGTGPNT